MQKRGQIVRVANEEPRATVSSTFSTAEPTLCFQDLTILLQFSRQPACDFTGAILVAVAKLLRPLPPGLRIPVRAEKADEIPEFFGNRLPSLSLGCLSGRTCALAMQ